MKPIQLNRRNALSHYQSLSATISNYQQLSATISHYQPLSATISHYQPLSATISHYQPLSAPLVPPHHTHNQRRQPRCLTDCSSHTHCHVHQPHTQQTDRTHTPYAHKPHTPITHTISYTHHKTHNTCCQVASWCRTLVTPVYLIG